ncbi:MAG: hypothetical protein ACP5J5_02855 [Dissulfurimicrobium sp.]|uniref:hypothetical protein n=1 Tax=Dissulfurimicrobium TaxID=1769732 RepID=UPI001EDB9D7B|nr:hypothetical protein [Dissulfurimicrobium hydrothermale]UKL14182.1 hypothetical protein LGS26_02715 [Dissulfurimicrobium hydrothermale]
MNQMHGVVYPVTYLGFNLKGHLSRMFSRLTAIIPAEDCMPFSASSDPSSMKLSYISPCPLGDRLQWFNGFIRSITSWARDVDLEAINLGGLLDSESIPEIITSLKKSRKDPLLKAQILLRLAHNHDRNEDEAEESLVRLKTKEMVLKDILLGEPAIGRGTGPDKMAQRPLATTVTVSIPSKRLAAWSELWTRANLEGVSPVGIGIDVKDLMDKAYESLTGTPAIDLLALKLPIDPSIDVSARPEIKKGLEDLAAAVSLLTKETTEGLRDGAEGVADRLKQDALRLSGLWDGLINGMECGPIIGLSLYPRVSFDELLLKASGGCPPTPGHNGQTGWSFYLY